MPQENRTAAHPVTYVLAPLRNAALLLNPEDGIICHLGDSEFDDSLCRDFDLLLSLGVEARTSFFPLLHQLAKTGQHEFPVLLDRLVGEVTESIEEHPSGSFVGLGAVASAV